ncbi:YqgE/AlgH family protein [Thaumasiovibrio subtropicus]|uniref:YqgE/AlgH family protein n=1 Tax=Thaumasiovibrio subtropicus TaxID=1891207 RepID=UPI000B361941|nr:YqgE/AlgH family protein [Thaumasiovibrio subtropicus]
MNLKNHFLVAMPAMEDPRFKRAVIYVCEHNDEGAMGLIINHPIDIKLNAMLEQIELERDLPIDNPNSLEQPVLNGGPVAEDRGFVLHDPSIRFSSSEKVSEAITVTTSKDVLATLGTKLAPNKFMVALGYAGWDAGQLEKELVENSWLTVEADPGIIFSTPINERWAKAIEQFGVNSANLSSQAGHA